MHTPGTAHHYNAGGGHRGSALSEADSRVYMPSITSEEILDENSQKHGAYPRSSGNRSATNRKVLIVGLLVFVAIAGAVVAYVVTKGNSDSASTASGDNNANANNSTSSAAGDDSTTTTTKKPTPTSSSDSSKDSGNGKVLSDPNTGTYPLTTFAIGDWGATLTANDSCCQRRKGEFNAFDWHAEAAVNKLMDIEARNKKPMAVISHGDNFYWTGIDGEGDQVYRFEKSFESRHRVESMMDVPWINVMGNHDYGGGSFICMENSGRRECNDPADLVAALQKRFELQSKYVSPNNNRWVMKDHFYIYSIEKDDVSIDVFNLDMNDAESHGAHEICCQCYAYAKGDNKKCKNVDISSEYCLNRNAAMYNACMGQFRTWGEEARTQLLAEVKKSKATWKIVNSHYNPYGHYGAKYGEAWLDALKDSGVHLWLAGHTHGEKHDYIADLGVHFIENGAGGGIQSESASGVPGWMTLPVERVWTGGGLGGDGGNTYGFFAIDASTEWLKVRYMTFGDGWSLVSGAETMTDSMVGGVATGHCWYVPSDGSKGQAC